MSGIPQMLVLFNGAVINFCKLLLNFWEQRRENTVIRMAALRRSALNSRYYSKTWEKKEVQEERWQRWQCTRHFQEEENGQDGEEHSCQYVVTKADWCSIVDPWKPELSNASHGSSTFRRLIWQSCGKNWRGRNTGQGAQLELSLGQ